MRRREFIAGLGGAAAWPLTARAQQPAIPVVGFLGGTSPDTFADRLRGFRQGLKDTGYVEGENVAIEYRWAENQFDRLSALVADLVRRQVAVIAVTGVPAASAAKAATTTIPIVFLIGEDPVERGLVDSLARPGGNLTGVGVLVNPAHASLTEITLRDVQPAARAIGLQTRVFNASTSREIDAAFKDFGRDRPDALFVGPGTFFTERRVQLALLATRYAVPATYSTRDVAEAGGLMSYGPSLREAYRQVGVYAGRILQGTKPADLPVVQPTKFDLVINLLAAGALDLTVPATVLARADEVIE